MNRAEIEAQFDFIQQNWTKTCKRIQIVSLFLKTKWSFDDPNSQGQGVQRREWEGERENALLQREGRDSKLGEKSRAFIDTWKVYEMTTLAIKSGQSGVKLGGN